MTDMSFIAEQVRDAVSEAVGIITAPSVLYKPTLSIDGTKWCALLGDDLATGIAGFGDTPAEAMASFDRAWTTARTPKANLTDRPAPASPLERERRG